MADLSAIEESRVLERLSSDPSLCVVAERALRPVTLPARKRCDYARECAATRTLPLSE
jgi:hypothetical protein